MTERKGISSDIFTEKRHRPTLHVCWAPVCYSVGPLKAFLTVSEALFGSFRHSLLLLVRRRHFSHQHQHLWPRNDSVWFWFFWKLFSVSWTLTFHHNTDSEKGWKHHKVTGQFFRNTYRYNYSVFCGVDHSQHNSGTGTVVCVWSIWSPFEVLLPKMTTQQLSWGQKLDPDEGLDDG